MIDLIHTRAIDPAFNHARPLWPTEHILQNEPTILSVQAFEEVYKREFGFVLEDRKIAVDDVRIRAMGKASSAPQASLTIPVTDRDSHKKT